MSSVNLTFNIFADYTRLNEQIRDATKALRELGEKIREHEEQWRCTLPGQWPDKFILLNRYVRTGIQAPYIFND